MIQYDYCFMLYFKILEPVTLMCFNFSLLLLLLLCCMKESYSIMHGGRGQLLGVNYLLQLWILGIKLRSLVLWSDEPSHQSCF